MLYTEKTPTLPAPIADNPPSDQSLAAIAAERERTIQVLQDTNKNLLDEIKQLRAYVGVTSAKYIQIVDQTLAEAKLSNTRILQLQAQVALCAGSHTAPSAPSAPNPAPSAP